MFIIRKIIKLVLLTAVASAILVLPVTASAEPRTQIVVVGQVPLEMKNYLGDVDLLPEGVGTSDRELPVKFNVYGVKSIEITGQLSHLVQAYTWKP
ncbi:hypothetical protein ACFPPD_17745 [Cohnella suwonensis]|uniref:Uncharacterized protein n=1 Tax=Cohnella suwonensis TaxID=696072 RepID=A0ABW0LXU2_9BACL